MNNRIYFHVFLLLNSLSSFCYNTSITVPDIGLFKMDSLAINFQEANSQLKSTKDTTATIDSLLKQSDSNKNKGLYAESYDDLWKAMAFANTSKDNLQLAAIHGELGVLYSIYGKEDEAIKHKKIALLKIKNGDLNRKPVLRNLAKAYYNLGVQYRKAKKYDLSLIYLDSCLLIGPKLNKVKYDNPYVYAEKGTILLDQNLLDKAESLLLKAREIFEKENKHYLVIVYSSLGDLYSKKEDIEKAISYYEKSLSSMYLFRSHTDLKVDILKKLASLFKEKGQSEKAYFYLEKSTKISDSLFSTRSVKNSELFEIKNKYKEIVLKKDEHISQQESIIEDKKRIQTRLVFVLGGTIILVFIIIMFFQQKSKMRKLQIEKENAAIKIKHDKEKLNIILETKRKELTVSALQLIEKDEKIDKLLTVIKQESPDNHKKMKDEIVRGNKGLWESFNLRFTEVNTDFYKKLREKHATLTPTEQKHCALIKLKFDSKEMARLLNISINSVHISRHRIRKKIGLHRDENLSNYISKF